MNFHFFTDKPGDMQDKVSGEKRGSVQLKRSTKLSEKSMNAIIFLFIWSFIKKIFIFYVDADTKNMQSTVVGSSSTTSEKRASSSSTESNTSTAASKKPIHQRLGAMTKTWKTAKKTWRTEKVLSITV